MAKMIRILKKIRLRMTLSFFLILFVILFLAYKKPIVTYPIFWVNNSVKALAFTYAIQQNDYQLSKKLVNKNQLEEIKKWNQMHQPTYCNRSLMFEELGENISEVFVLDSTNNIISTSVLCTIWPLAQELERSCIYSLNIKIKFEQELFAKVEKWEVVHESKLC